MSNPVTAVFPLTSNLNGTGQSGALSLTGVDPIRYDGGLFLEEAEHNYVRNPCGTVAVNWAANPSITLVYNVDVPGSLPTWMASRVPKCLRLDASSSLAGADYIALTTVDPLTAVQHAIEAYVWVPSAVTATGLSFQALNYTGAAMTPGTVDMGLRDQWQSVVGALTPVSGDLNGQFFLYLDSGTFGAGQSIYLTLASVQAGYRTTPAAGTMGDGYSLAGGNEGYYASDRAASSASISPSGILTPDSGSIAFRLTRKIDTGAEERYGECGQKASGKDHLRWGVDSSDHPFVEWSSNNAAYQRLTGTETISVNTEYLFYLGWNGVLTELSIDAGTKHTGTRDVVEDDFSVGDLTLEASAGGVIVSPFATFDRPLTDTEIATLAARQGWSMSTLDSTTRRIRAQFELRPAY